MGIYPFQTGQSCLSLYHHAYTHSSSQILPKREQQPDRPRVRLLVIWFGTNDACEPGTPLHVPVDRYATELESMISLLRDPSSAYYSPDTRIVLIGPPPCQIARTQELYNTFFNPPKKVDRDNDRIEKYVAACKAVANKAGVPFIDPYDLIWKAAGSRDEAALQPFFIDGLHPAEPGYKVGLQILYV
jgi:isoamyl acetate esterase